ncbi:hypothetical protein KEH19_005390, partial [Escherichia coli]|nr:hypothetical protein [Escherichia coli]
SQIKYSPGNPGRFSLHKAEGIVEGMLMMLGVRLEMDRYVERELPGGRTSVFYQRKNSLRS